jgi:hypothetical protein
MTTALVRAYRLALSFYPPAFRRRYADELRLDFEDGLHEAVATGAFVAVLFACRTTVDLCASLLREWSRGTRAATAAATTGVTIALWGLALRPWTWKPSFQPQSRDAFSTAPVDVWELVAIAVAALVPVIAVIVLAPWLVPCRARRRVIQAQAPPSVLARSPSKHLGLREEPGPGSRLGRACPRPIRCGIV